MASTTPPAGDELSFDQPLTVWRYLRDRCDWPMRDKMAYWCLYSRRGSDGRAPYPGLRTLAMDMGTTPNAASAAVAALEALGAIEVDTRAGDAGQNVYAMAPPWECACYVARRPRGIHARGVSETDTRIQNGHASPKQRRVSETDTAGVSKTDTAACPKQIQNEPMNKPMKTSQCEDSSTSPAAKSPRSSPHPKVTPASLDIVTVFDEELRDRTGVGVEDWGQARKVTDNVCKGSGGAQSIPVEEAIETLRWAMPDPYHRKRFMEAGLRYLRAAWAAWKGRDQPRGGPAPGGPQRSSNVILRREKKQPDSYYDHIFNKRFEGDPPPVPQSVRLGPRWTTEKPPGYYDGVYMSFDASGVAGD